jgi:hypothetical protein
MKLSLKVSKHGGIGSEVNRRIGTQGASQDADQESSIATSESSSARAPWSCGCEKTFALWRAMRR